MESVTRKDMWIKGLRTKLWRSKEKMKYEKPYIMSVLVMGLIMDYLNS